MIAAFLKTSGKSSGLYHPQGKCSINSTKYVTKRQFYVIWVFLQNAIFAPKFHL